MVVVVMVVVVVVVVVVVIRHRVLSMQKLLLLQELLILQKLLIQKHAWTNHVWTILFRVGQNRIYTPYMTVYMVSSLPKIPYTHRKYMVLANPKCVASRALIRDI